jgi:hypothetical protein
MSDGQRVFVATETFSANVDGTPVLVKRGKTRVHEGHELVVQNPQWFEEAGEHVQFQVETATAEPGEKRTAPSRQTAGKS